MRVEVGGFLGLLVLIADVWAIVHVFGSNTLHRRQGAVDRADPDLPGGGLSDLAGVRPALGQSLALRRPRSGRALEKLARDEHLAAVAQADLGPAVVLADHREPGAGNEGAEAARLEARPGAVVDGGGGDVERGIGLVRRVG